MWPRLCSYWQRTQPESCERARYDGKCLQPLLKHWSLNEHLCPIYERDELPISCQKGESRVRRHKCLKYMQAVRSSSQRVGRSKSWCNMQKVGKSSRK